MLSHTDKMQDSTLHRTYFTNYFLNHLPCCYHYLLS